MKEYSRTFVPGYVFSVPAILLVCLVILIAFTYDGENSFAEYIMIICMVIVFIMGLPWNIVMFYGIIIVYNIIVKVRVLEKFVWSVFESVFIGDGILYYFLLILIFICIIGAHINGIYLSKSVHNLFGKILRYLSEQDTDSGRSGRGL